jgi:simple sugar transport system permease protein
MKLRRTKAASLRSLWALGPILAALVVGAAILAVLGRNPLAFYGDLFRAGLFSESGWQAMLTRMAPLLLISPGYIVAFRAGIWNIGGDGQFLLAGAVGVNLASLLIKEGWRSETTMVPQTASVPLSDLLPRLGGTTIHIGIVVAVVAIVISWYVLNRTAAGLRLTVLGANPRAALHAGIKIRRLIVTTFFFSGALIGLAAAVEILGEWGYMRAGWNPEFGLALFALVFLARLSPVAVVPFAGFYAVLEIGGHEAARKVSLDYDFVLILIALVLLFMAVTRYLDLLPERRSRLMRSNISDLLRPGKEP